MVASQADLLVDLLVKAFLEDLVEQLQVVPCQVDLLEASQVEGHVQASQVALPVDLAVPSQVAACQLRVVPFLSAAFQVEPSQADLVPACLAAPSQVGSYLAALVQPSSPAGPSLVGHHEVPSLVVRLGLVEVLGSPEVLLVVVLSVAHLASNNERIVSKRSAQRHTLTSDSVTWWPSLRHSYRTRWCTYGQKNVNGSFC